MGWILHSAWRATAPYRVRIGLQLKGASYDYAPVDLIAGEQREPAYRAVNRQGLTPALDLGDGTVLTQSLAIIDWLDATVPEPRLVPADPADRAHAMALALAIACDIHPLNNLRVLKYLGGPLGQDEETRNAWYAHWIAEGFAALETLAAPRAGRFLFGDAPGIADVCLVPQMFNARRFAVPLDDFPTLVRADAEACQLDAFAAAHPDKVASAGAAR